MRASFSLVFPFRPRSRGKISGQYGLFEWNMTGTRGGADPHFHKMFSESFYVMEGTVRLFNGETWIDAVKGDFLYVP
jgi:mannose-6-phosphate isomerase-like protein (cupin superfamily)